MDKLEEVMPSVEEKEIKKDEAGEAAGRDDAADEVKEEERDDAADEVKEEERDDAADEVKEEERDDAADEEVEEEGEEAAAGKDDASDELVKKEGDDDTRGSVDEPGVKAIPQTATKIGPKLPWQVKSKEKKPDECLNLNNEVVRMRKEVKRVRALIIRKLTRQMGALKKKKGKETEVERNQRRAGRLLEEIHAMKTLAADVVSKTALQRNLNFNQVCKNPKSTVSDRAIARIATHPQFNKKIQDIKAAVKAFKEERLKGGKDKMQIKGVKVKPQSPDKRGERAKEERGVAAEQNEMLDKKEGSALKDTKDASVAEPDQTTGKASPADRKEKPKARNVRSVPVKGSEVKDVGKNKPQVKSKPKLKSAPEVLQKKMAEEEESDSESGGEEEDELQAEKKPELKSKPEAVQKASDEEEEESDLESGGEMKEYFDDSTEERFLKKSSQSESDGDNGFFVGKVRKFSKKKKKSAEKDTTHKSCEGTGSDKIQGELDALEARLKSKAPPFQSVFFSSLSSAKPGGGRGAGRGRGGDGFRGRGRPGGGPDKDFSRQPKSQKQERESFPSGSRGRGRGRGRGGGFTQHAPEQALHPSWEASKKRKEQQGQILAFQGKKIKFDMDD